MQPKKGVFWIRRLLAQFSAHAWLQRHSLLTLRVSTKTRDCPTPIYPYIKTVTELLRRSTTRSLLYLEARFITVQSRASTIRRVQIYGIYIPGLQVEISALGVASSTMARATQTDLWRSILIPQLRSRSLQSTPQTLALRRACSAADFRWALFQCLEFSDISTRTRVLKNSICLTTIRWEIVGSIWDTRGTVRDSKSE